MIQTYRYLYCVHQIILEIILQNTKYRRRCKDVFINENIKKLVRIAPDFGRSKYIRLDMNENPVGLPKDIIEELKMCITAKNLAMYPNKIEMIERLSILHNLDQDQFCLTDGSEMAIKYIFDVFAKPSSSVVTVFPRFEMYGIYCNMFGLKHKKIAVPKDFTSPVEEIVNAVVALEDILVNNMHREGITLLFRNDIEKIVDDKSIDIIRERILEKNIPLIVTDTIEAKRVYSDAKREKEVLEKINLINKSKLVITDRFHGMVFAVITHTPVIAFKSYDSKISSGVKWFENLGNVHLVENGDIESVFKLIDRYLKTDEYFTQRGKNNAKEILMSNMKRLYRRK